MSDKTFPLGSRVSFETRGRYRITHTGTLDRYEAGSYGEWAVIKLEDGGERKTRPTTLRAA